MAFPSDAVLRRSNAMNFRLAPLEIPQRDFSDREHKIEHTKHKISSAFKSVKTHVADIQSKQCLPDHLKLQEILKGFGKEHPPTIFDCSKLPKLDLFDREQDARETPIQNFINEQTSRLRKESFILTEKYQKYAVRFASHFLDFLEDPEKLASRRVRDLIWKFIDRLLTTRDEDRGLLLSSKRVLKETLHKQAMHKTMRFFYGFLKDVIHINGKGISWVIAIF